MRAHIRSNVVGYVALFFAFTGGAYALGEKNTADSGDISKTLTAEDIAELGFLEFSQPAVNDSAGASATDSVAIESPAAFGFQIIGRCNENPASTVTGSILLKTIGSTSKTSAADSTAPGGVNSLTGIVHGTEVALAWRSTSAPRTAASR